MVETNLGKKDSDDRLLCPKRRKHSVDMVECNRMSYPPMTDRACHGGLDSDELFSDDRSLGC